MIRLALLASLVLSACAGVSSNQTAVAVVIETDLTPPNDVDFAMVFISAPSGTSAGIGVPVDHFPISLLVIGHTQTSFSGHVELSLFGQLVVQQSFSAVRFVPGVTSGLKLRMLEACRCDGTNCPTPEANPDCAPLIGPALFPFDDSPPPSGSLDAP